MTYRFLISKEVASFPDIFHDLLQKLSPIDVIDKIRNSHLQISTQVYIIMEVDKSYISNPKEGILHMITMVRNSYLSLAF